MCPNVQLIRLIFYLETVKLFGKENTGKLASIIFWINPIYIKMDLKTQCSLL